MSQCDENCDQTSGKATVIEVGRVATRMDKRRTNGGDDVPMTKTYGRRATRTMGTMANIVTIVTTICCRKVIGTWN